MRGLVDWWMGAKPDDDPLAVDPDTGLRAAVVVTGGSRGIGFEIAARFAAEGRHVVLVARNQAGLADAVRRLRARDARFAVTSLALDVASPQSHVHLLDALAAQGAFCSILVNSAAIGIAGASLDRGVDEQSALVATNVDAPLRLALHVLPDMVRRRSGGVINIASFGGLVPGPYQAAYYASKAFMISHTEALAWELRGRGVRLCVVAPGPVETGFHRDMRGDSAVYAHLLPKMTPERVARAAVDAFWLGRTLAIPGVLLPIVGLILRLTPRRAVSASVGALLRPRG